MNFGNFILVSNIEPIVRIKTIRNNYCMSEVGSSVGMSFLKFVPGIVPQISIVDKDFFVLLNISQMFCVLLLDSFSGFKTV